MDALPDELLLQIFALVADADTLLDGVARTCKRWLRVSRDPAAWANVRVEVRGEELPDSLGPWCIPALDPDVDCFPEPREEDSPPSARVLSAVRVLLRAPALRAVVLDWEALSDEERVLATSALRRCRAAQVREVRLVGYSLDTMVDEGLGETESALLAVTRLLWRLRHCLRALDTLIIPERSVLARMMCSLMEMRHLEKLHLRSVHKRLLRVYGYDGQLRDRLPRLRVLAVRSQLDVPIDLGEHGAVLAVDLLRGAASSLRAVDLRSFSSAPEVVAALAACTGLRELHCNVLHVPVVRGMTHLRCLHLQLCHRDKVAAPTLRECLRAVERDCREALAGVRALQLHADAVDPDSPEYEHLPPARELFAAVARGACHAEDVSLHLEVFYRGRDAESEAAVSPLLSPACLPRVRRLFLDWALPADLERVAALPDSLVAVDGGRLHCETLAAGEEAVFRLKQRRSELKVDLYLHPWDESGYRLSV